MPRHVKSLVTGALPRSWEPFLRNAYSSWKTRNARRLFRQAATTPEWLDKEVLPQLQARYPQPPDYGYNPEQMKNRGLDRAAELLSMLPANVPSNDFLELGCSDGMVGYALIQKGKTVAGIDITTQRLDRRAQEAGVRFITMDATRLEFPDQSFDFIYSYNAFEHFLDPAAVLKEAARVLRPGGMIYLSFGPLYMAAYGLHAYRGVTVPFCQLLFRRDALEEYTASNNLPPIPYDGLNMWGLSQYRALWDEMKQVLDRTRYEEIRTSVGAELIEEYPSCFRAKTSNFDDLVVTTINVLFRKHGTV